MHEPTTPPTDQAVAPATERLGRYEILRQLAVGGMAELHLARVTGAQGFEKLVVIKRILPQLARESDFVQMFLDEARIAATLHHSNIVQVYDMGVTGESYFCAMEFLHGADVRRVFKTSRAQGREVPLEHTLNILCGVCAGLHYAHEKTAPDGQALGIVHRDVSPQNVFVTFEGGVKLLDFGIAKASHRLSSTQHGTLKGKIPYMSPEQCRGEPLDRRADVYAVAVMLWELTTGCRLRHSASEFAIMKAIVEEDAPRPSSVKPGYPPDLEAIVMRGLMRDQRQRYQTAQELQLDLEAFAREWKLAVSSVSLAQFMRTLFRADLEAWNAAQREGAALADHIAISFQGPADMGTLEGFPNPPAMEPAGRSPSGSHAMSVPSGDGASAGSDDGLAGVVPEALEEAPTVPETADPPAASDTGTGLPSQRWVKLAAPAGTEARASDPAVSVPTARHAEAAEPAASEADEVTLEPPERPRHLRVALALAAVAVLTGAFLWLALRAPRPTAAVLPTPTALFHDAASPPSSAEAALPATRPASPSSAPPATQRVVMPVTKTGTVFISSKAPGKHGVRGRPPRRKPPGRDGTPRRPPPVEDLNAPLP